jgi:hypothetical protein
VTAIRRRSTRDDAPAAVLLAFGPAFGYVRRNKLPTQA